MINYLMGFSILHFSVDLEKNQTGKFLNYIQEVCLHHNKRIEEHPIKYFNNLQFLAFLVFSSLKM